jgi:hypothetical protein
MALTDDSWHRIKVKILGSLALPFPNNRFKGLFNPPPGRSDLKKPYLSYFLFYR